MGEEIGSFSHGACPVDLSAVLELAAQKAISDLLTPFARPEAHAHAEEQLQELERELERLRDDVAHRTCQMALLIERIYSTGLYRVRGLTFEEYMRQRWGRTRQRGHQLLSYGLLLKSLSTSVDKLPSELQGRQLCKIEESSRALAWKEALQTSPTANEVSMTHLKEVIRTFSGPPQRAPKSRVTEKIIKRLRHLAELHQFAEIAEIMQECRALLAQAGGRRARRPRRTSRAGE